MPARVTPTLLALLDQMMEDPAREWYGLELMAATGLQSGTLYPLLHRLVDDGWLERTRDAPSEEGGTSRRLYRLTGQGALSAPRLLAERKPNKAAAPGLLAPKPRAMPT
jgi:PadR family transcriptional regulator PadR